MAFDGLTMNPEAKEKWCQALESGKFRQGRGKLKLRHVKSRKVSYCCMGVFCEIQGLESKYATRGDWDHTAYVFDFGSDKVGVEFPDKDWFAQFFEGDTPAFPKDVRIGGLTETLSEFNDENKQRFKTIARWIRENL